jgi:signal transduction histidine kinase/HAMP domain-containing protein
MTNVGITMLGLFLIFAVYLAMDYWLTEQGRIVPAVMAEARADAIKDHHAMQMTFAALFVLAIVGAIAYLRRAITEPLQTLRCAAEQLTAGTIVKPIPIGGQDELGGLARTLERLGERMREKNEQFDALHATGQEITMLESGLLDHVLRRIADRAADLVRVDLAVLMVHHPIMECWVVEAASGAAFDTTRKELLLFEETPFSNEAFATRAPVVVADLGAHTDRPVRFRDQFGAKSYMAVPLLGPHECIGVLVLMSTTSTRTFTDWEIRIAQQFASYAAVTMENVRLFDVVESRSHDLQGKLRAMERQVAELTHEVVAPAGRVAEFAAWLEQDYRDRLDEKGFRYLEWIKKEGHDLAQLAGRTLDLAKMLQERSPLESVDANEVVRDVINLLAAECEVKGITLAVEQGLPLLACRRIHVKQVFENLIGNAIKYMGDQPEPRVEIGTDREGSEVMLYVRDNGIGMDPAMAERIFEPFQRLGTVDTPGAGIGLTIVRTVVEHYSGVVRVDSRPGVGSKFSIRLPLYQDGPAADTRGRTDTFVQRK